MIGPFVMMTYHEITGRGATVMDGRRLVAAARHHRYGWMLTAYGFSWTNPKAHKPNIIGKVVPSLMLLRDIRQVRKELKTLAGIK